jgi:CheY-like chemotaxis protein
VDDDKALRFHSRQVLEAFGLDVMEAESGEQAIAYLDHRFLNSQGTNSCPLPG